MIHRVTCDKCGSISEYDDMIKEVRIIMREKSIGTAF